MGKLVLVGSPALAKDLRRIWAGFPESARAAAGDVKLRAVPREKWEHDGFTGWYGAGGIQILALADNPGGKDAYLSVAAHECGHHFYWMALAIPDRQAWREFWKAHRPDLPSDYARLSVEEGFCESVEWTYHRPAGTEPVKANVAALVKRLLGDA